MKIRTLALGASSTGKTCFLYAMAQHMKNGQSGFIFKAVDEGQRETLSKGWTAFSEQGLPPDSTTETKLFDFECKCGYEDFASFSWLDYRGGAIIGNASEEKEKIMERMLEAECLMIFVGADEILQTAISPEQLRNLSRDERREIVGKVNALNERLACYNGSLAEFRHRNGRTVPVALVVTKGDLLGTVEEFDAAKSFMKEKFSSLFAPTAGWKVALMRTGLNAPEWGPWEKGDPVMSPYNMHLPIVFGLLEGFRGSVQRLGERRERLEGQARDYRQDIRDENAWWGLFSDEDRISELESNLADIERSSGEVQRTLNVYKNYASALGMAISASEETCIYFNGSIIQGS